MTEFTCRSGGSNLNAGTLDGTNEATTAPLVTYASGTYDAATRVFTPASGNPVTDGVIAGTHWVGVSDGLASLRVTGVASSNASCPDSAALSFAGDLDIRIRVRANDWTPAGSQTLVSKYGAAGQRSYLFVLLAAGTLQYISSNDGTATPVNVTSTASTSTAGVLDSGTLWLRVTHDVDNGAAGNDVRFYTSFDGSTWTQLGSTVTTAGTTSIFDSTTALQVGEGNGVYLAGNVYYVEVRDGIGGTVVASPDFAAQSAGTTSFSDAQGNTWTVGSAASIVAATSAQLTALVSARDATTITLDATRRSGGVTSGTATLIVGGAWRGPNGTDQFPLNHVSTATVSPRINLKNDQTYSITAGIAIPQAGPGIIQGYTSTFGDAGRFTLDGGTSGASYILLTVNGANWQLWDFVLQNNGASGSANLMAPNQSMVIARGLFRNGRSGGFNLGNAGTYYVRDVEFTALNQANTSTAAISTNLDLVMERCYIHDNPGASCRGLTVNSATVLVAVFDSIFDANGQHGVNLTANGGSLYLHNCDFYANGGDGVEISGTSGTSRLVAENCNFVQNGGYGIDASGAGQRTGRIINCGFGSGTAANTSGTVNSLKGIDEISNVTYTANVTPWRDPANGDFTVTLAAAKNGGRGTLPGTTATSTPVIGAAQSPSGGSGGGVGRVLRTGG